MALLDNLKGAIGHRSGNNPKREPKHQRMSPADQRHYARKAEEESRWSLESDVAPAGAAKPIDSDPEPKLSDYASGAAWNEAEQAWRARHGQDAAADHRKELIDRRRELDGMGISQRREPGAPYFENGRSKSTTADGTGGAQ